MSKVKVHSVDKKERVKIINELLFVISDLKSKNDISDFFFGILTQSEILMIARRLQIAKLLLKGEGYDFISKKMHVSHQTINKTEQWIRYNFENKSDIIKKINSLEKVVEIKTRKEYDLLDKYARHRIIRELLGI